MSECGGALVEVAAPALRLSASVTMRLYECVRCGGQSYLSTSTTSCPRRPGTGARGNAEVLRLRAENESLRAELDRLRSRE